MKKILLFFIISYLCTLFAEVSLNSKYLNVNHFSTIESSFNYHSYISQNWLINQTTEFNNNSNDFFDRSYKNSHYIWKVENTNSILNFGINYDYNNNVNKGLPEDSISVVNKTDQSAGISFKKILFKNFYLNQLNALNKIESKEYLFYGKTNRSDLVYFLEKNHYSIRSSFNYSLNDTYMEKHESNAYSIQFNYKDPFLFNTFLTITNSKQDSYEYQAESDTQYKNIYLLNSSLSIPLYENFQWNFIQNSGFKKNNYSEYSYKNNWTLDHYLESNIKLYQNSSKNNFGIKSNIKKRYLKIDNQYRKTVEKILYDTFSMESTLIDSIIFDVNLQLTQNYHSLSYQFMDNDRFNQFFSVSTFNIINKNMIFKNYVSYLISNQVYINRVLSANNNQKKTYFLKPEYRVNLFNNFQFYNIYSLRATYEDFIWNEYQTDRFYRKLNGEWGFIFLQEAEDDFRLLASFNYETDETAENIDSSWVLNNKTITRYYSLKYTSRLKKLRINIEPQIKYLYKNFETEMLVDLQYLINQNSYVKFYINPFGNQFNTLIWKTGLEMSINY